MGDDDMKKKLRGVKRELLSEKHDTEVEIEEGKKRLRRTKRKLKQVDEMLRRV